MFPVSLDRYVSTRMQRRAVDRNKLRTSNEDSRKLVPQLVVPVAVRIEFPLKIEPFSFTVFLSKRGRDSHLRQ